MPQLGLSDPSYISASIVDSAYNIVSRTFLKPSDCILSAANYLEHNLRAGMDEPHEERFMQAVVDYLRSEVQQRIENES